MIKEIIIFGFLLLFLVVGLLTKEKIKKFKDYSLGNRAFTKVALSATVVATLVGGGSTIGSVAMVYKIGIIFSLMSLAWPIGYILIAVYIIPRLEKYYGHFSLPQVMGSMYGIYVREYLGIISYIFLLGVLAMQVEALSVLFFNILGYKSEIWSVVSFIMIIIYTSVKGITGVVKTDILQVLMFIITLPFITLSLIQENTGTLQGLILSLPKDSLMKDISIFSACVLIIQNLIPDDGPDFIHRMLIGRNTQKNRVAIYLLVLVSILVVAMVLIISTVALVHYPDIDSENAIFVVIKNFFNNEILYSIFGAALVAIIVSSADSILNTSSVIIVNDVVINKMKNVSMAKLISFVTGILAVIISLRADSIMEILLFCGQFYNSSVTIPFFFGLFINNKSPKMFWYSSLLGTGTYLLMYLILPGLEDMIFLFSISASAISYLFLCKKWSFDFIFRKKGKNEDFIKLPIKKLGLLILPISVSIFFSNTSFQNLQMIEVSIVVANLLLISAEIIYAEKMRYRDIIYPILLWYCFPVFSIYLYLTEINTLLFAFLFPTTLILLSIFYKWERALVNLLTASVVASILLLFSHKWDLNLLISKFNMLFCMLLYIIGLSYFIIRPKEEEIKGYINNIKKAFIDKQGEIAKNAIKTHIENSELLKKHEISKQKFLKFRSMINEQMFCSVTSEINIGALLYDLESYFQPIFRKNNVKFFINKSEDKNIETECMRELIYILVFSITNFFIQIKNVNISISYSLKKNKFSIKYVIQSFSMHLKEIEKYVVKSDCEDQMLSLETVKNIIQKTDFVTLKQFKNTISLSINMPSAFENYGVLH